VAARVLSDAGLPAASVARVAAYILATKTHLHSADRDEHVVVDADMCVLGAPLQRYAQYAAGVRREYGHLSDEEYTQGR
jgi:predicted metal-dependent HD superfamily phosphohydrolase